MLLDALSDHIQRQFSSVQSEILRLQCHGARGQGFANLHVVFADIRKRSTSILVAELRQACVANDVAAEMTRALDRLLLRSTDTCSAATAID